MRNQIAIVKAMRAHRFNAGTASFILTLALLFTHGAEAQMSGQTQSAPTGDSDRPLPDMSTLMHQVEEHQKLAEAVEKDYIYDSTVTEQELDGHNNVKKTTVEEYEFFWINGVRVRRLLKKDGKQLTVDQKKKEEERIEKEAIKEKERREKAAANGKATDASGQDVVTVSRFLELGSFTNAHRIVMNGRDTIVADYAGDPKARTRNSFEGVVRVLVGTVWIDERDHALTKVEGHFLNAFKIGGGLMVDIQKDTRFMQDAVKINDEVWLPSRTEGHGSARFLLFFKFNGNISATRSNYRKFTTKSTVLPVGTAIPDMPR